MMSWKTFLGRAAVAAVMGSVAVFVGVRLAAADPGSAGGPTADSLTFAGVLRGSDGRPITSPVTSTFTFVFHKGTDGGTPLVACRSTTESITVPVGGSFSVVVPIDPVRNGCPRGLFDGAHVTYDLLQDVPAPATPLAMGVPITPVPYARFADQAGVNNDCPAGYSRDPTRTPGIVCTRPIALGGGLTDEVVKVGRAASAFWIDRYEAGVWGDDGVQRNSSSTSYLPLQVTGQWMDSTTRDTVRAYSHAGVSPNRGLTWFQASALCAASGKRLMTRREWFAAADGLVAFDTANPTVNGDVMDEARCNTTGTRVRVTGRGTACTSSWGVQDLVGNATEWTDEWYASVGLVNSPDAGAVDGVRVTGVRANDSEPAWPSGYADDRTSNITSTVLSSGGGNQMGLPAAAVRGGQFGDGSRAGVFSMVMYYAPAYANGSIGFRCVVPR